MNCCGRGLSRVLGPAVDGIQNREDGFDVVRGKDGTGGKKHPTGNRELESRSVLEEDQTDVVREKSK